MSGAHVFSNAHDITFRGSTIYAAETVSGTVRYLPSKLMALDLLQIIMHRTMSDGVIPLVPNPSNRFTGQTEVITKLRSHFSNLNNSVQKRQFFLLYGMGGIGKTQICAKLIDEMSDR
jgi:flagellar biosynthesis GTPase FlhF